MVYYMDNSLVWKFLDIYFRDNPDFKVKHHLDSYNNFISEGIAQILNEKNPIRFFKEPGHYTVKQEEDNFKEDDYRYECELYLGGLEGNRASFGYIKC